MPDVKIKSRRLRKIIQGNDNLGGQVSQMMTLAKKRHLDTTDKPAKEGLSKQDVISFAMDLQSQLDAK